MVTLRVTVLEIPHKFAVRVTTRDPIRVTTRIPLRFWINPRDIEAGIIIKASPYSS